MAAEVLAHGGADVTVYDAMPSAGRKFLMAGRGGLNLTHSEPLADFLDFVVLGDGEEAVGEITEVLADWKRSGTTDREGVLRALARVEGVYVPSMYDVRYDGPRLVSVKQMREQGQEVLWADEPPAALEEKKPAPKKPAARKPKKTG